MVSVRPKPQDRTQLKFYVVLAVACVLLIANLYSMFKLKSYTNEQTPQIQPQREQVPQIIEEMPRHPDPPVIATDPPTTKKVQVLTPDVSTSDDVELAIGIISAPRKGDADYVYKTVAAIDREMKVAPNAKFFLKKVVVFNPREEGQHRAFERAREDFSHNPVFDFVAKDMLNETYTKMGKSEVKGKYRNMRGIDLQQNADTAGMMTQVYDSFCVSHPKGFMMIMEDDFELCQYALIHLHRAIYAAEHLYHKNFAALRVSYGFNGMILHCHDLANVRDYLSINRHYGPPDAMLSPYWTKHDPEGAKYFGTRYPIAYRHNIMNHIGFFSSVWNSKTDRTFPLCYDDLYFNGMSHNDWFDFKACKSKEFYPCENPDMGNSILSMFRAHPEFDTKFQMPDRADTIQIIAGERGDDCHATCEKEDLTCARWMFPLINRCRILEKYFDCKECVSHPFHIPNKASRSPMMLIDTQKCYESHIASEMRCDGQDNNMRRICACAKLATKTKSVCVIAENPVTRIGPCDNWPVSEKLFQNDVIQITGATKVGCGRTWYELPAEEWIDGMDIGKCPDGMTLKELKAGLPNINSKHAHEYISHMNAAFNKYEINNCKRRAAFFAQASHESGDFGSMEAIASAIGNFKGVDPGSKVETDEERFRGRGPLQLKGRKVYEGASKELGVDFVKQPDLMAERYFAFKASAWYWQSNGLNELADKNTAEAFDAITKVINVDMHGKVARDIKWDIAKKGLGC